jgi:hypothetical protein
MGMAVPPLVNGAKPVYSSERARSLAVGTDLQLAHTKMPWIERYLTAKRRRKVRQAGRPTLFYDVVYFAFPEVHE